MGEVRGLERLLVHTVLFVDPKSDLNDRDFVSAGCGQLSRGPYTFTYIICGGKQQIQAHYKVNY